MAFEVFFGFCPRCQILLCLFVDVDRGFLFVDVSAEERCGLGFRTQGNIVLSLFSFALLPQSVDYFFLPYLSWTVRDEKISCLPHERYILSAWLWFPSILFVNIDRAFLLFVVIAEERCELGFGGHGKIMFFSVFF